MDSQENKRRILYASLMELKGLHKTLVDLGLELHADGIQIEVERIRYRLDKVQESEPDDRQP